MKDFDAREWNLRVKLICDESWQECPYGIERAIDLLICATVSDLTVRDYPKFFEVNRLARQKLGNWVQNFSKYESFVDGCWLLMRYYDTENLLKSDYWTLVELHTRWSSLISCAFFYGNKHQIANFVPFASKIVTDLVAEMQKRKRLSVTQSECRPKNWRLSAKQVKEDIDPMRVVEHYFPDMKPWKKGSYRALCRWHTDTHPSLTIYPDGHIHCFVCNHHDTDSFGLVMDIEKCDFATAVARVWELGK